MRIPGTSLASVAVCGMLSMFGSAVMTRSVCLVVTGGPFDGLQIMRQTLEAA